MNNAIVMYAILAMVFFLYGLYCLFKPEGFIPPVASLALWGAFWLLGAFTALGYETRL